MTPEQADLLRTLRIMAWRKQYQHMHSLAAQVSAYLSDVWQAMQPAIHQAYTRLVDMGYITPPVISENARRRRVWAKRRARRYRGGGGLKKEPSQGEWDGSSKSCKLIVPGNRATPAKKNAICRLATSP